MQLLLLLTLVLMAGCQTSNVSVDYDTQASFDNYRYYSWKEPVSSDQKPPSANADPLTDQRVKKAVLAQLQANGMQPASQENPADVLVRFAVINVLRTETPNSSGSVGLGRSGGSTGVGISLRFPLGKDSVKRDVTILIDLLDAGDETLKWRGSKTLVFGDSDDAAKINTSIEAAVAEIFNFYPPAPVQ